MVSSSDGCGRRVRNARCVAADGEDLGLSLRLPPTSGRLSGSAAARRAHTQTRTRTHTVPAWMGFSVRCQAEGTDSLNPTQNDAVSSLRDVFPLRKKTHRESALMEARGGAQRRTHMKPAATGLAELGLHLIRMTRHVRTSKQALVRVRRKDGQNANSSNETRHQVGETGKLRVQSWSSTVDSELDKW
ncbi:hypothetical protein Q8A73_019337 [Channa argus]|nr:hypothetical protein Q8A73_019337 [Channa argus]